MEQPILSDKNQFPSQDIINSHIGKNKVLWESLFDFIGSNYPEINWEWRYYNDGKSWLMKVTRKAKTVFWLSLFQSTFRITFYFTDKAKKLLEESSISDVLKEQFRSGKSYGKIKGVTIIFKKKKDVEDAKSLIDIKLRMK